MSVAKKPAGNVLSNVADLQYLVTACRGDKKKFLLTLRRSQIKEQVLQRSWISLNLRYYHSVETWKIMRSSSFRSNTWKWMLSFTKPLRKASKTNTWKRWCSVRRLGHELKVNVHKWMNGTKTGCRKRLDQVFSSCFWCNNRDFLQESGWEAS